MKILLLTSHSKASAHLAAISLQNHWRYSAQHGYDFLILREEWEDVLKDPYGPILKLLPLYDVIMTFGSDVLFTNFDIAIESILQPGDSMVVAREPKGWLSKFNLGVVLFCNTPATFALLRAVQATRPAWMKMRLITQDWLNLNYEQPVVKKALRLVPTRTMNSAINGIEGWQPGDLLIHFYGRPQADKPRLMTEFLAREDMRSKA